MTSHWLHRWHIAMVAVIAAMAACSENAEPNATTVTTTTVTTATEVTDVDGGDDTAEDRLAMVSSDIAARGVSDANVLDAMRQVPRHRFVPSAYLDQAYDDHPLPIGHGQTISQPYIVALMSAALDVEPGDRVLEIGTGSGYQAAVLAAMGLEVYTIEVIPELAERAAGALAELGYDATTQTADGYFGWPEFSPFDGIIVTAAPDHVPQPLVEQLDVGAHMVIPVGPIGAVQTLWRFTRSEDDEITAESLGPVSFVPLVRPNE